jgi:hypothetical protein
MSENSDVYIDLLLLNSIQTNSNHRVQVNFMQNSSQPFLKSINGYKLSIIRFALNTETLPIFIPTIQSKNKTIYSITMGFEGIYFQQFMNFEPQNLNPVDPDEYYYVYNYQYLIYLVNKCFVSCLAGLAQLTTGLTDINPKMTFDSETQKCTITLDNSFYGYNETNKINIFMNYAMFTLFSSLPSNIINKNILGMDLQLNNLISTDTNVLTQEYSTTALWNPISSIIFTSNLIPMYSSQTLPIQIYTNGTINNGSSNFNFLNILTDFIGNDLTFIPYI